MSLDAPIGSVQLDDMPMDWACLSPCLDEPAPPASLDLSPSSTPFPDRISFEPTRLMCRSPRQQVSNHE